MQSNEIYNFSNAWFEGTRHIWDVLIEQLCPKRILEVGSYEGRSACYYIDKIGSKRDLDLHCIDPWSNFPNNENLFIKNTNIAIGNCINSISLNIHKGKSITELPKLLSSGFQSYFDLVYIDGSHRAQDVLFDAVLAFQLTKCGGLIVFDDYLWNINDGNDISPLETPKIAIDAFTNIYLTKIKIIHAHLYQLYVQKQFE